MLLWFCVLDDAVVAVYVAVAVGIRAGSAMAVCVLGTVAVRGRGVVTMGGRVAVFGILVSTAFLFGGAAACFFVGGFRWRMVRGRRGGEGGSWFSPACRRVAGHWLGGHV